MYRSFTILERYVYYQRVDAHTHIVVMRVSVLHVTKVSLLLPLLQHTISYSNLHSSIATCAMLRDDDST